MNNAVKITRVDSGSVNFLMCMCTSVSIWTIVKLCSDHRVYTSQLPLHAICYSRVPPIVWTHLTFIGYQRHTWVIGMHLREVIHLTISTLEEQANIKGIVKNVFILIHLSYMSLHAAISVFDKV